MKQEFDYGKANNAVNWTLGGPQKITAQERGDFYVPMENIDSDEHLPEHAIASRSKKILLAVGVVLFVIALFAVNFYLAG